MPTTTVSDTELLDALEGLLLGSDESVTFKRLTFTNGLGPRTAIGVSGVHATYGTLREMLLELSVRRAVRRLA